ncbi:MAG: hypothetical protein LBE55_05870 [Clostridiales bacterium]|nr:hypothetical protein [Clostridiales bacterium]
MKPRHVLSIAFVLVFALMLAACDNGIYQAENGEDAPQIPVVEIDETNDYAPYEENYSTAAAFPIPDYIISLEIFPEERLVSGVAAISFQNMSSYVLDKIFLSIPFNAFTENFPYPPFLPVMESRVFQHGRAFGSFDVNMATINLNPAEFSIEGTLLTIYLDEHLAPGVPVEIGLVFTAHIPRISHRTGGNDYAMWFGNFLPTLPVLTEGNWYIYPYYPVGNPFFTATSNYHVNITAPAEYTIVSTGLGVRSEGETNAVTTITVDQVRDFAFAVLSPTYESREIITEAGVGIAIYFRGNWDDDAIDAILNTARTAFDYFEARIGIYPHQSFDIVETEMFVHDAIKYPGIVFVDALHMRTPAVHGSIARDIGHQWFYDVVGNNPVTEPWLAHGLVSFLQLGLTLDEEAMSEHMQGVHQSLQRALFYIEHPELFRHLGYYASWSDFHNIQFLRGQLLFYNLWQRLGDEDFDQFVRLYYGRYAFSIAASQGLIAIAEEIYGQSLADFFDEWINSPALPEI